MAAPAGSPWFTSQSNRVSRSASTSGAGTAPYGDAGFRVEGCFGW